MNALMLIVIGWALGVLTALVVYARAYRRLRIDCRRLVASSKASREEAYREARLYAEKAAGMVNEVKRLRQCLGGVSCCSTCEMCRGAASVALAIDINTPQKDQTLLFKAGAAA
jgi:hypothetical protein